MAAVSIPHLAATSLRLWMMRRDVDGRLLRGFGLASAAGGLAGALLQTRARSHTLDLVLGGLLLLAGTGELTGLARRMRLRGKAAWVAGALSGVFATAGAIAGTLVGQRLRARIPENVFRRAVAVLLLALGVYMLARPG